MGFPLTSRGILSFQQIGVDPKFANISNTALSQDKYLCIREVSDTDSYVVIVDLQNNNSVTKHKMKADTAVMHPSRNIIALRRASMIQVFDLDQKQRLNSYQLPKDQNVNYWKWIDEQTLAFIAGGYPNLIFQLQPQLASGSIINYSVSHDQQWFAVSGLVREGDSIVGKVQLFSRERNISQVIDAYTASFANVGALPIFVFSSKGNGTIHLNIFPLGSTPAAQKFGRRYIDLPIEKNAQDDLPLHLIISKHFSSAFLFTKLGYLYCAEIETPFLYISARVSQVPFTHVALSRDGGVIALSCDGRMSKFGLNQANIIDFIATKCGNPHAAAKVAAAAGLKISVDSMSQQLDQLIQIGNYAEAAKVAVNSPGSILRNQATIEQLRRIPNSTGGDPPLLQYFKAILENTKLNEIESIELCKIVLAQNKTSLIEKWIKEEKLTPTEELGDLCKQDTRISLAIYLRANVSAKVVASFAELGMFDKLLAYCQKFTYQPNWMQIATIIARQNPDKINSVLAHIANKGNPLVDPKALVQMLLQFKLIKAATSFLIDVLPLDREEDSELQTLLFEIAINNVPNLAEKLFSRNCFSYYDRQRVAALCERAGNFQRALEHYIDLPSIKRCIVNTQSISQDFIIQYFDHMSPDWSLECLRELLKSNPRGNVQLVVTIAGTYWQKLGIDNVINLFNETNSSDGIYFFLAQVANTCDDPDVHFRYIEAAAKIGNYREIETMCQNSQHLQAERVRDYLIQQDLTDKIPLIVLCNRFGFVEDLTKFLYKKNYTRELETYIQKFNPKMAGRVIGVLIDIEAPQDYITKFLKSVQNIAPIDDLIEQTMKRERIRLLEPILYDRAQSGATDSATNNGLVLLAVLSKRNGEKALRENQYYDPKFVGQILANRDARLACIAFAKGNCDDELIELTNQHKLYKEQARYCVAQQSPELWKRVLSPDNKHMKLVVDAVISTAILECDDPDKVTQTVKAFVDAQIPTQLLGLLEKVVMESLQFQNNTSLQDLLIITAIKSDTSRVKTYVTRLNDYTWNPICEHLILAQLYDEAVAAYKKFGQNVEVVHVMLTYNKDIKAALEWAQHCDEPAVWGEVARAQLAQGQVVDAIDSFIKAKNTNEYIQVIKVAEEQNEYNALVQFLQLARQMLNRNEIVDTKLCYAYAKTDMLKELKELTSSPNSARIKEVADRCFDDKLFKACKILYTVIDDTKKLEETLRKLSESKVDPLKIHDQQKIEKDILQYFMDIIENKNLDNDQLAYVFQSTIAENKPKLVEKWRKESSTTTIQNKQKEQPESQKSIELLDLDDIKNMVKVEVIGRGATSEVYKVSSGQFLAMKTLLLEDDDESEKSNYEKMKRLIQEYELLKLLNHPNIVKEFGIFLGKESNPPCIVLEYCPTNLKKSVKKLTNVERVVIIYQISNAMQKVHSMDIIHRDLKPENILLDDQNQVKVSDFGFSKIIDSQSQFQSQMSVVGTMNFMAPEILLQKEKYDSKVDVYSFGVIVYFILMNGKLPPVKMLDVSKGIKPTIPESINKFSRELISKCWNFEPSERPTFEEICNDIINNKFQLINGIDENDPIIQKQLK